MQKKLLALAVAGALVPAAAMAQSSVEIYGRANLSVDSWEASGATAGSAADFDRRMRVVDSGSRLGFRVNESLGGGLRVPVNDRLSLTLGFRGYLTLVDSDSGFLCSSVDGQGTCLVRVSGSTVFQGEATAGLALRF